MKPNKIVFGLVTAAALSMTGAAFVPGTAEAHCGGHRDTCADWSYEEYAYSFCQMDELVTVWNHYSGYCDTPQSGCSGAGCADWPCAEGACSGSCFAYDYIYSIEVGGGC